MEGVKVISVTLALLSIAADVQGKDSCFLHGKSLTGLRPVGNVINLESAGKKPGKQDLPEKATECQGHCDGNEECSHFTVLNDGYDKQKKVTKFPCSLHKDMWMKGRYMIKRKPQQVKNAKAISGPKECGKRQLPAGICEPQENVWLVGVPIKYEGYEVKITAFTYDRSPSASRFGCFEGCDGTTGCEGWFVYGRRCQHLAKVTKEVKRRGATSQVLNGPCKLKTKPVDGVMRKYPCYDYGKKLTGLTLLSTDLISTARVNGYLKQPDEMANQCHERCTDYAGKACKRFTAFHTPYPPVTVSGYDCYFYGDTKNGKKLTAVLMDDPNAISGKVTCPT